MIACPYAKSDMTPCVRRDGDICWAMNWRHEPICVGCERSPETLGLPRPADWEKTVAEYEAEDRDRRKKR
jgi:hypothetical protein